MLDFPEKTLRPLQCRQKCFLDNVLGKIGVAQLQRRDTQQISAMGMDLGGECGIGGVGPCYRVLATARGDDSANATAGHVPSRRAATTSA